MKTNKLLLPLILTLLSLVVCAQTKNEKNGALLWEISGKDLKMPSYILGTLHLESGNYLDSIPGAQKTLESCEQVVGEVVIGDMYSSMQEIMSVLKMDADTTYHILYSEDDYRFLDEQMKPLLGIGLDQMGTIKPAAIHSSVVVLLGAKYIPDFNPQNLLDIFIQQKATESGKTIIGLESAKEQASLLFESMPLQRQADILLCTFENKETLLNDMDKLIYYYHRGDLSAIDKLANDFSKPCSNTQEEMRRINGDRNNKWMKKLPEIMKEKSSFIAVGALHLVGDAGLLTQLEKLGYKVEAVK